MSHESTHTDKQSTHTHQNTARKNITHTHSGVNKTITALKKTVVPVNDTKRGYETTGLQSLWHRTSQVLPPRSCREKWDIIVEKWVFSDGQQRAAEHEREHHTAYNTSHGNGTAHNAQHTKTQHNTQHVTTPHGQHGQQTQTQTSNGHWDHGTKRGKRMETQGTTRNREKEVKKEETEGQTTDREQKEKRDGVVMCATANPKCPATGPSLLLHSAHHPSLSFLRANVVVTPNVMNPLHSKSCHIQCCCYPIQVQRTSQAMNVFPSIGLSLRIPSDCPLG